VENLLSKKGIFSLIIPSFSRKRQSYPHFCFCGGFFSVQKPKNILFRFLLIFTSYEGFSGILKGCESALVFVDF
jgi:hypothetical protein